MFVDLYSCNVCSAAPTCPSQSLHQTPFYSLCFPASLYSFLMFFRVLISAERYFIVLMRNRLPEYKHRMRHNRYINTDKSFDYTDASVGGSSYYWLAAHKAMNLKWASITETHTQVWTDSCEPVKSIKSQMLIDAFANPVEFFCCVWWTACFDVGYLQILEEMLAQRSHAWFISTYGTRDGRRSDAG